MEEHEILNNEYFKVNRFLLKLTGLWPYQKRHVKLIIRILYICAIHSMMIPQVIRTVEEWGKDFEIVLENIVGFIYLQCVLAKYIITFTAEPQLVFLYKKMAFDWTRYIEAEEQLSLQRAASNGQLMTIIYSVYVNFAGVGFATLPGTLPTILNIIAPLNESRPTKVLCFYAEYFIDQEEYYYQLLFQTFIGVMSTVFINATVDTLYVICAHHSDGLFNIVSYRFQKAFNKSQERYQVKSRNLVAAKNLDEEIHEYVLTAINIHNESIEFINLIQSTYTLYFFIQMSLTIISLSLATVVAMMNLHDIINLIRIFFIWCGIILNLAYISIAGQQIIDTSLQIFDSAYFCGWYNHPLKTQRLLKFIMLRCSRQCQITAGPMLVINLESCSNILKSSLSYCTFMIAVS
ncbi:odorant receptor 167 [Nasonia vitripennis]|uniref:Odorant receptor n=1 Tax=Nasonia vitripennis TaxID=7425 RepID=A0A7M6UGB9_NASVI|nr:odorant receptor 167 [Nasonia vitripennis]